MNTMNNPPLHPHQLCIPPKVCGTCQHQVRPVDDHRLWCDQYSKYVWAQTPACRSHEIDAGRECGNCGWCIDGPDGKWHCTFHQVHTIPDEVCEHHEYLRKVSE